MKNLLGGAALLLSTVTAWGDMSEWTVVVPKDRALPDRTAAAELVAYLGKITGRMPSVVTEDCLPEGPVIHLGQTARVREEVEGIEAFAEEEWAIRRRGNSLLLAGGGRRGTLYAVYHYLEDVCGVRWLTPVAEDVPRAAAVPLPMQDLHGRPAMPYRDIYVVPGEAGGRFLARNRMQSGGTNYGHGPVWGAWRGAHTLYTTLGDTNEVLRLFREHPEWFPLIDGRRWLHEARPNGGAQSQLCLTNPDLRKHWIACLRADIRKDRAAAARDGREPARYWAIDQNDAYDGFCQCANCRAVIDREGATSGLMLDFCNEVAATLESEAPDAKFSMMAEHVLEKPPRTVRGRRNVTLRLCDTTSNMLYPWTDRDNAVQRNNLMAWAKCVESIMVWDYQITYTATSIDLPIPTERTFAPDIRLARDQKGEGFFFEHEHPVSADMRDLKVWLEIKLLENPDLDDGELVRDFTDRYYGAAAGALIRRYRDRLGEAADSVHPKVTYFPMLSGYAFLTGERVVEFYGIRERALAAVEGDAERTARVEHAFLSLDRLFLIRASVLKRQLAKSRPNAVLPDVDVVLARYRRIFDREAKARCYTAESTLLRKRAIDQLETYVRNARDLPIPTAFKDVPAEDLLLIPATFSETYYNALSWADDASSPAGRVLTVRPGLTAKYPTKGYEFERYAWPLKWAIWPTATAGVASGRLSVLPAVQPAGYHWYKTASDLPLLPSSVLSIWPGFNLPLDGAVSDNAEIGQKYDVWVSVKVTGPDLWQDGGRVTDETVYFLDQVAVIRKTRHGRAAVASEPTDSVAK